MSDSARMRREPPPFRAVEVVGAVPVTTWLRRITLGGDELDAMERAGLAASVRLLLPGPSGLVMPAWNGNEFLLPDGTRPILRTMTPRFQRSGELDVDVVLHEGGAASTWARSAVPGDRLAVSGPGRSSAPDPGTHPLLIAGDQAAVPAIAQLLENLPSRRRVEVLVETGDTGDPAPLPDRRDASITWLGAAEGTPPGSALCAAFEQVDVSDDWRVWAAGEAAAMQRIRRYLADRGITRSHTTVRGYWKHGKAAGGTGG